jgi:hypothetical protein
MCVQWVFPEFSMLIRSVVNAVDTSKKKLLTVFALNEWDPKVSLSMPWRKMLDTVKGQVRLALVSRVVSCRLVSCRVIANTGCLLCAWCRTRAGSRH